LRKEAKFGLLASIVLLLYSLCSVCPERLVSASIMAQRFLVTETDSNCHKKTESKTELRCESFSYEHVPSDNAKISTGSSVDTVQFLAPNDALRARDYLRLASLPAPGLGPPFGLRVTKLRI
jgi:hypothetical protein